MQLSHLDGKVVCHHQELEPEDQEQEDQEEEAEL